MKSNILRKLLFKYSIQGNKRNLRGVCQIIIIVVIIIILLLPSLFTIIVLYWPSIYWFFFFNKSALKNTETYLSVSIQTVLWEEWGIWKDSGKD